MESNEFKRRRELLTMRLTEQIKTFNKKLLVQNFNVTIFIFMLPILLCAVLFLLGTVFKNAAYATKTEALIALSEWGGDFVMTNHTFHMILGGLAIVYLCCMLYYHVSAMIKFTKKDMEFASFILAKYRKDTVASFENLKKEVEFRDLNYNNINKVAECLLKLNHVILEKRGTIEKKAMIRISDW